jgi:hypothetical protein
MEQKVILFGVDGLIPELVYKFAAEGYLPNISKIMKGGSVSEILPYINLWGDVNFVSLLSGQAPGTSWNEQGKPETDTKNVLRVMEEQGKKCALVHFPATISNERTEHFIFAPFGGKINERNIELIPPAIYSTHPDKWPSRKENEALGWPPTKGTLAYHLKTSEHPKIEKMNQGYKLELQSVEGTLIPINIEIKGQDSIALSNNDHGISLMLTLENWSDWATLQVDDREGSIRFKLLKLDEEKGEIDLLQSQVVAVKNISNDHHAEQIVLKHAGPFIQKWTVTCSPSEFYYETSYEEGDYQAQWLANAAITLVNHCGYDVFATVFRLNDETHHTCLAEYDPVSPYYSTEKAKICEEVMRKSYEVLDQAIGHLLAEKSEDTMLMIVSDHGNYPNSYVCDIHRRLSEFGLIELDSSGNAILEKSKAFLKNGRGGLEVYVNLKGREAHGIVEREQYEQVQTEIFRSLTTWYHETPEGLINVTGVVIKKQDASLLGYWGERTGDVLFAYNKGFVWGRNAEGTTVAAVSRGSANHGPQIPTARSMHSSNLGIALIYGKNAKNGYLRNCNEYGYYRMDDVGNTIAQLIGLNELGALSGQFMRDCFFENV